DQQYINVTSKIFVVILSSKKTIENDVINKLANGSCVWIGLYRHKVWSDGSNTVFKHWAENQPDQGDQKCIAASLSDSGRWSDETCSQSFPFIFQHKLHSDCWTVAVVQR
uniref:C-type lectin domain-containing protein n=1 Tax=Oryzias latipes TaxID=8090 RepID=A0A3B3HPK4_ORYLA